MAALASWLDAQAHQGQWLVRIEDVDQTRCQPTHTEHILRQLSAHGLCSTGPVCLQSTRSHLYEAALAQLLEKAWVYPCNCSRKRIQSALSSDGRNRPRHEEIVYPGLCRNTPISPQQGVAWRLHQRRVCGIQSMPENCGYWVHWHDRRLGAQAQDVISAVGDFVLKRSDVLFAYQLAVTVDDATQGVTHVVRGEDLADNTARQIVLQHALGYATPVYLHTPLVVGQNGEKLSKQNGASPLPTDTAVANLCQAARSLDLHSPSPDTAISDCLSQWVHEWRLKYPSTIETSCTENPTKPHLSHF